MSFDFMQWSIDKQLFPVAALTTGIVCRSLPIHNWYLFIVFSSVFIDAGLLLNVCLLLSVYFLTEVFDLPAVTEQLPKRLYLIKLPHPYIRPHPALPKGEGDEAVSKGQPF